MRVMQQLLTIGAAVFLLASTAAGQDARYSVTVTPEQAVIQPGEGVQLEAHLFDVQGASVEYNSFDWVLQPDSLAEITPDGFLRAGREHGEVIVLAVFKRGNVRYVGKALVRIGQPRVTDIEIFVTPTNSVVPPGTEQAFKIRAVAKNNRNFRIDHIRWTVAPRSLGKISQDGIFVAGDTPGQGAVVAYVDIAGAVYRGDVRVTVSAPPSAQISGTVLDDAGSLPLVGAHVRLVRLGDIRWGRSVKTDSTGSYTAAGLIPGLYVAHANARDYLPEYYDNQTYLPDATPIQVAAGDSITGIDFMLGHGGTITGLVGAEMDSLPIGHALVTAVHVVTQRPRHAVTREDGTFELRALRAGQYAITARAQGFEPEIYDNQSSPVQATLIPVTPPDSVMGIDIYLETGSAIAGTVTDATTGEPLVRAKVLVTQATSTRARPRLFGGVTDSSGTFLIGVPPGSYIAYAGAEGHIGEFWENVSRPDSASLIVVTEGMHTTGIDFGLETQGSISGAVTDASTGAGIGGAVVVAFFERDYRRNIPVDRANVFHPRRFKTRTDSTGAYTLAAVPPGAYYLVADAKGYLPEYYEESDSLSGAKQIEIGNSQHETGIDFTLSSGGAITGTVADSATGMALPGATVTIWSHERGIRRHTFADPNGNYGFRGLPSGEYLLFSRLAGYEGRFYHNAASRDAATPVAVTDGSVADSIDFDLPDFVSRLGVITGVVTAEQDSGSNAEPTPIAGAFVLAVPVNSGILHFDFTDAFGNYQIGRLIPGEYVVVAWARGYLAEFFDDAHAWQDAQVLQIVADERKTDIDFALEEKDEGPYRIRGLVRDRRNSGRLGKGAASGRFEGAIVYAFDDNGLAGSAIASADGEFSLDGMPAGEYKLKVNGAGLEDGFLGGTSEEDATTISLSNGDDATNLEIQTESTTTGIEDLAGQVPDVFALEQNYPNPFNPQTTVRFALPTRAPVALRVYNVLGQVVHTLVDQQMEAGFHEVRWNGTSDAGVRVASGIYLLRIEAGEFAATRRMVLMK